MRSTTMTKTSADALGGHFACNAKWPLLFVLVLCVCEVGNEVPSRSATLLDQNTVARVTEAYDG